ncbi:hypothetical protein CFR76_12540 [Komagataeibacter swingsii]|uniref:Peptidase S8/S53 domain-containing protein n=2 Tax=Komagataeibacter swingsii TaxID=215220 RepID=A0A2V4RA21_9PROT|nr:hypothetical protein CFR76_12540 [Komagataeibacter swingsii]
MTGAGVRIAVIDSGVQAIHPHIDATRLAPGIMIGTDGRLDTGLEATCDQLGHGTAVIAAIQEKAPDAVCLPVRVFGSVLRTSGAALVTAIHWAVRQEVDLINLSLGSTNPAHMPLLSQAIGMAVNHGVSVIAARDTGGRPCYPGMIKDVIGVTLDWDIPRTHYRIMQQDGACVISTAGYPRAIPGVPLRRNLYGVSFAVAQVTGFAALALEPIARPRCRRSLETALKAALEVM